MSIYSVKSGQIAYVSDAVTEQDAAAEIIDKTFDGAMMGAEIYVTNMMTGECSQFDTMEILQELNFEFEDEND